MTASARLIRRILATETAYSLARLQHLAGLNDNAFGVAWRQLDAGALAQMLRGRPLPAYNRVLGLRADLLGEIEPVLAWYRAAGIEPELETISAYAAPEVTRELVRRGYFQAGFRVLLAGRPPASAPGRAGAEISAAAQRAEAVARSRDAAGIDAGVELSSQLQAALGATGSHLYLSATEGPAAATVLFLKDGIGFCAPAALFPSASAPDVAPVRAAIADAALAGVEWVCAEADLLSPRHRQLVGLGLEVAFVRALWSLAPSRSWRGA
jgi:hypothetical protein